MPPANPAMLANVPTQFETERLLIRVLRPGDGPAMNEAIRESQSELYPWMPWARTLQPVAQSEEYARRMAAHFVLGKEFVYAFLLKKNEMFLGILGLHPCDWNVPSFETGYWLRTSMVGNGYVTEALNAIIDLTFNTLHAERLFLRCDDRNKRSAAVAERCGFTLEGCQRNHARDNDGNLVDMRFYSRIASDSQ